jgi:bacterioferritin
MKANTKLIDTLNQLLADELTAISEYMAHAEMCEEWGYDRLHEAIKDQAKDEMKHAEKLVSRILFLGGVPTMSKLNPIKIGKDVPAMLGRTEEEEEGAIGAYNRGVKVARECGDESTAHLLGKILRAEERHKDWAERQRLQIAQMGLENYLAQQIVSAPGAAD